MDTSTQEQDTKTQESPKSDNIAIDFFKFNTDIEDVSDNQAEQPQAVADDAEAKTIEGDAESQTSEDNQAEQNDSVAEDAEEQKRFQYWQRKFSEEQKRAQELESKVSHISELPDEAIDLARALAKDPSLVDVVEKAIKGEPIENAKPSQQQVQTKLTEPQRPERPSSFNEYDSYTDPDSDSFKYRQALDNYRDDMINYMREKDRMVEQKQREQFEAQQRQAQVQEKQSQLFETLRYEHNMTANEIQDFTEMFSQQTSVEDLVSLYKLKKGKLAQAGKAQQKAKEFTEKQNLQKQNPPIPSAGGARVVESVNKFF